MEPVLIGPSKDWSLKIGHSSEDWRSTYKPVAPSVDEGTQKTEKPKYAGKKPLES